MEFIAEIQTVHFWTGLMAIIWINIILSGDNAVVIALAARSLPKHQQGKAIFWGAGAAVALRIVLTLIAVEALKWPFLKIIGGLLLFWIAVKLLMPEDGDADIESSDNLIQAIKTILIADLVMSLDNVIGVAAAAKGSVLLLVLGLVISIPLVIFGATVLMKLMERFPVIITIGAALIGYVAGEMPVTDPAVVNWFEANAHWLIDFEVLTVGPLKLELSAAGLLGAAFVVVLGKWLAARGEKGDAQPVEVVAGGQATQSNSLQKVLIPLDGSQNSLRAVRFIIEQTQLFKGSPELHLLNVQRPLSGAIQGVSAEAKRMHQDQGARELEAARKLLDAAGVKFSEHIGVGEVGETVAQYVRNLGIGMVMMSTRGAGAVANALLGSGATEVLHRVSVPVLLVK